MPIYGFNCRMCKTEFETLCNGSVEAGIPCTNCGSTDTEREDFPKVNPPSFVVKGASAANNYGLKPKQGRRK